VSFRQVDVTDRAAVFVLVQDLRRSALFTCRDHLDPLDVERARFVETPTSTSREP